MRFTTQSLLSASLLASAFAASSSFAQTPPQPPAQPDIFAQQPGGGQSGGLQLKPHMLVSHLPDAQNCPAPDWMVPGMRMTYFTSVATVNDASGTSGLVEDPNGDITSTDGRKFRMTSVGHGVGGTSWDWLDVVAVEPPPNGVMVLEMRSFSNTNGNQGPAVASGFMTFFVHPSGCDFFIHPRLLGQLQQSSGNGVSLLRGTTTHRGTNYDILASSVEASGSKLVSVYDLRSGVQISHNSSSQFQGQQVFTPGADGTTYSPQSGNSRALANNQFHGARKVNVPWPQMRIPDWARTTKMMRYQGQRIDSGTPEMGLGRLVTNLTFEFHTAHVGQTFIAYQTKRIEAMEGLPAMEPMTSLTACGSFTPGVWLDPKAMANVRAGTVYDNDQNTGVQSSVEFVGADRSGKQVIVFAMGNQMYKATSTYDLRTGQMIAFSRTEKSPTTGGTITLQCQLTAVQ